MKKSFLIFASLTMATGLSAQILHVPSEYATIQVGINAATPGDTVLVAEGKYYEKIDLTGHTPIVVGSLFIIDGSQSHIANTIIDGSQLSQSDNMSVVTFGPGNDTTSILSGFTIQGGKGTLSSVPDLKGGGIWISGCGARVAHNIIQNNVLNDSLVGVCFGCVGGGISMDYAQNLPVIIENNLIRNNSVHSVNSYAHGGGLSTYGTVKIINNTIENNSCSMNNTSGAFYAYGGGLLSNGDFTMMVSLVHNQINGNIVNATSSRGGGVYAANTGFSCSGNEFTGNEVQDPSGTGNTGEGDGGGLFTFFLDHTAVISGNHFISNIALAAGGWGGGIYIYSNYSPSDTVFIENNIFKDNQANRGGALGTATGTITRNNVFASNVAVDKGGAMVLAYCNHQFINNSFYHNQAGVNAGSIYSNQPSIAQTILNCVFWKDSLTGTQSYQEIYGYGKIEIAFCDIDTNLITIPVKKTGPGNFIQDPLFSETQILHPYVWSPCVDAGTGQYTTSEGLTMFAPEYDILGTPRPAGAGYDIGAYDDMAGGVGISGITDYESRITNFPNPFSISTTFVYDLKESCKVNLEIYDSFGRQVATLVNGCQSQGKQEISWEAPGLPTGIYFYRLQAGNTGSSGKIIKK
jgi:hypothetical protein